MHACIFMRKKQTKAADSRTECGLKEKEETSGNAYI